MSDEDDPKDETFTQADVDRIVKDRLKRVEAKFSDYDELKAKADQLAKIQKEGKSADDRLTEQVAKLEADLTAERLLRLKTEVAVEKGLTPAQAKRLSGNDRDELEADADDLLEAFPSKTPEADDPEGDEKRPADRLPGRPKENLRGGGKPDEEPVEVDPAKLADLIPRDGF